MSSLGFIPYLAYLFVPGLGAGELFKVWRPDDSLAARVAYCFGMGLCVDTLLLAVKTAGITPALTGLEGADVYLAIGAGAVLLFASVLSRRRFSWWRRPTRTDLAVLAIMIAQGLILVAYLQKYPIFPESSSHDFVVHVQNTKGLISGTYKTIPNGLLYGGIYFQLAPALLLVGGSPLVTIRWTMALLTFLSPLLFYLASQRLSGSDSCGLLVSFLYSLSGTIWFGSVFNSGLYANFFGIMAALFLLVAFLDATGAGLDLGTTAALALATVTAYFSHYSVVTLMPAILAYPLIKYAGTRKLDRTSLVATAVVIIPGVAGLAAYPRELNRLIFAETATAAVTGSTFLSRLVSSYPVLSYMILEVYSDVAFLVLAALACWLVWRAGKARSVPLTIPVVWLATLLVVSPFNVSAWRYSYEALVPFTLMAGIGAYLLLPKTDRMVRRRAGSEGAQKLKAALVLALIFAPAVGYSWGTFALNDALTSTGSVAQNQGLVNETMAWLGENTPSNSTYLSVSDWRFTYTSLVIGRETSLAYTNLPSDGIALAEKAHAGYIIVTYLVTETIPAGSPPSDYPWNNFPTKSSENLTLIYSNPDVRVYQVVQ